MRQETLASQEGSKKFARKSKREVFLDRMELVLPWGELLALVEPHHPQAGSGQRPVSLSILLRTYFVQQWFNLSDPGVEEALYESPVLRSFVGVDLDVAPAPDEMAIRQFRQLLEEHDLGGEILAKVNCCLDERGIHITIGTNGDTTINDALSLTKYTVGERDSQMHQAGAKAPTLGTGALSVAVISPDMRRRNAVIRALGECQTGQIQEFVTYPPDLNDVQRMLGQDFDVVLVDLDSNSKYALNLVETISIQGLAIPMVYSEQADPDLLLRSMRAGAREFLTLPLDTGVMAEALVRASAIRKTVQPPKKEDGGLLVFLSAKGGSGVTTLACNYAVSLAEESGQKTLLIDLNLPLGDAAINLGIQARYSTIDALQNSSRLDTSFLSTMLVSHSSGLFVLAAPSELAATAQFSEGAVNQLLEVARQEFDYVVVDAGSRLDLQQTHLFDESTTMYLVTQIGVPELRNANRLISRLSTTSGPKLSIVINRYDPRNREISDENVTKALTRSAEWKIPNNYAAVRRMQNTAISLMDDDSEISRAIRQMTRGVCGQPAIPEKEKKKGFSFFR
ncbi:MAG TPA: transposase [Terracidiphilus sp.]|nr:transposase [Terracidiphilus sp.]